eukprot:TRINITY_DN2527_c0_g1_i1.p1 TRINITY_DN2527_c0_g1~~TRINITY_DN2527_c0_g1_i1.p1  ORF type:complete len:385 (+),score=88.21 TRINITY_DN2527_c0_g1_i1:1-1155(+)
MEDLVTTHLLLNYFRQSKTDTEQNIMIWPFMDINYFQLILLDEFIIKLKEFVGGYRVVMEFYFDDQFISLKAIDPEEDVYRLYSDMMRDLGNEIETFDVSYFDRAQTVIQGCAKLFEQFCDYIDHDEVQKIKVSANESCGLDEMIPYEVKWCAWPSYHTVSMPDINTLSENHILFMRGILGSDDIMDIDEFKARFFITCHRTPCHEIVHIIQHISGQSANTFQAEHDASYAMIPLMWLLKDLDSTKSIFPGSFPLVCYIKQLDIAHTIYKNWSDRKKEEYTNWRNNFGLVEVPLWRDEELGLGFESECKNVLASEAAFPNGEIQFPTQDTVRAIIDTMFKERTGNILDQPVNIPTKQQIQGERILVLVSPVSAADIQILEEKHK